MRTHPFRARLQKELWIQARKDGFVGSGTTLRRIAAPIIHVVNIEGSKENMCYLNLGAHLCFLPSEGGTVIDPGNVLEYHCAFRKRIEPPAGPAFGWAYLDDSREAAESIAFVLAEWNRVGCRFFAAHGNYPDSFRRLLDGANVNSSKVLGSSHPLDSLVPPSVLRASSGVCASSLNTWKPFNRRPGSDVCCLRRACRLTGRCS